MTCKKPLVLLLVIAIFLSMYMPVHALVIVEDFSSWDLETGASASWEFESGDWRFESYNDGARASAYAVTQDDKWNCFGISSYSHVDDFRIKTKSGTKFHFVAINIDGWVSNGNFTVSGYRNGHKVTGDVNISYT